MGPDQKKIHTDQPVSTKKSLEGLSPEPNACWTIFRGYDPVLIYFPVCVGVFLSGMGGCLINRMI